MKTWTFAALGALAAAVVISLSGCTGGTSDSSAGGSGSGHDHDHGTPHTHEGPHDGHVMAFKGKEYHAEWKTEDSGKVTFYFLDAKVDKEVAIDAPEITIEAKIGENAPTMHKLAAVNPQDGKAAVFEAMDPNLQGVLSAITSANIKCTLHVTINGKQYDEEVKEVEYTDDHHAGHDHAGHDHAGHDHDAHK